MRRSGKRSTFSTLRGLLPVVLLIVFVAWVLWRRRTVEGSLSGEAFGPLPSTDDGARWPVESNEPSMAESLELPPPASPSPDGPGGDEAVQPTRGRIEDLLERARLEDDGAA